MPGAAVTAVGTGLSLYQGRKAAKKNQKAQQAALDAATTQLSPFQFFGPGGISGGFGAGAGAGGGATHGAVGSPIPVGQGQGGSPFKQIGKTASGVPIYDVGMGDIVFTGDGRLRRSGSGKPVDNPQLEAALAKQFTQGITGTDLGGSIYGDLGELNPAFQGLVGLAGQGIEQAAGGGGMPQALAQALARAGTPIQVGQDGTLDLINQGLGGQFAANLLGTQALQQGGFARGLQNVALSGAQDQAALAATGFQDVAGSTLDLLRQQAQPFEQRAFQDLQENLFSTGRLGTSGGALQTEAFARGLAQADTGRQLQALQEARAVQQQALQQAQGLSGIGTGVRGLEDQLLQSAFGRFAQTAGLAADVTGQRFQQNLSNAGLLIQQNQANFGNVLQSLPVGRALRQSDLNFALQALQGQGALFDQSLKPFEAALAAAQAKANAEIGAGSNIASIVGDSNFNPGAGNEILQGLFTQVAQNSGGIVDTIKGIFNRGGV